MSAALATQLAGYATATRAARVADLADRLAADGRFQDAVTLADVDGVPIAVVLAESDELTAAARLARLHVTNTRAEQQQTGGTR